MLNILGNRRTVDCNGRSRRDFLKAGALGLGGFMLPDLLRARAAAANKPTKNTSVIWLWLAGGASQFETFDPRPENTAEFRSVVGHVQTNVPGTVFGGLLPKIARHADKLAVIRSFTHGQADHAPAQHMVMTGYDNPPAGSGAAAINPSMGSILSRYRGTNSAETGLPTYTSLDSIFADGPAWLGTTYNPFSARGNAQNNLTPVVPLDQLSDRRSLLKTFDTIDRKIDRRGMMQGMDGLEVQAYNLLLGRAREAFDISRENPRLRDHYGPDLGEKLLLARRLCEAGVGFVTIAYGGWDSHGISPSVGHGTIEQEMHKLCPKFDHAVAAFLDDFADRGLEKDVLFVIATEFGRTPWLDKVSLGRGHWPHAGAIALAGGGLKKGCVIGQASVRGDEIKSTPVSPQDLMATVFHVLGVPQDLQYRNASGRPVSMIDGGKPVAELIG